MNDKLFAHMLPVKRLSLFGCSGHFHVIVTHSDTFKRWTAVSRQPWRGPPTWQSVVSIFSAFNPVSTRRWTLQSTRTNCILLNQSNAAISGHIRRLKRWRYCRKCWRKTSGDGSLRALCSRFLVLHKNKHTNWSLTHVLSGCVMWAESFLELLNLSKIP